MPQNLDNPVRRLSVVQHWVGDLRIKQQSVLLLSLRGPDGCSKYNAAKELVKFLRRAILHPANPDYMESSDGFFRPIVSLHEALGEFKNDHDMVPHHFIMHMIHAYEIVAFKHPDMATRSFALCAYECFCEMLHLMPEDEAMLDLRLGWSAYQTDMEALPPVHTDALTGNPALIHRAEYMTIPEEVLNEAWTLVAAGMNQVTRSQLEEFLLRVISARPPVIEGPLVIDRPGNA